MTDLGVLLVLERRGIYSNVLRANIDHAEA